MLRRIDLKHFKCFELLRLPLEPLTLLSGTNSSGKSSVLQALVLLQQTMREHEWSTRLMLNGESIKLGAVSDVVDHVHGRHSFEIGIVNDDRSYQWMFTGERTDLSFSVNGVIVGDEAFEKPEMLRFLLPTALPSGDIDFARRLVNLTYLTAERIGPREIYTFEDRQSATVVGPAGERAISVLYWGKDEPVLAGLELPGVPKTRFHQLQARMRMFFPDFALVLHQIPHTNAITLGMRTSEDTEFHRPVNVGFGLTQIFPIVVAALSAAEEDILLIENPEVHLHPAGQAMMGQFLAEVAKGGVQVILETHSDHILNGIRRAVKQEIIEPENVALHFFKPRLEAAAQVESLQLDKSGNVDFWPDGFFDQFDKDMDYFAGWGD